jgi:hypothetical protein
VRELGLGETTDEVLFRELHRRNFRAVVTKDSKILAASVRRQAWQTTTLSLFVFHGSCGNLPLFEQMRCLIWWWPSIYQEAAQGVSPAVWTVRRELRGALERRY